MSNPNLNRVECLSDAAGHTPPEGLSLNWLKEQVTDPILLVSVNHPTPPSDEDEYFGLSELWSGGRGRVH